MIIRPTLLSLACAAGLMAGPQEPVQPQKAPACTIGPVAYQTFTEGAYFHLSARVTLAEAPKSAALMARRLSKALQQAGLPPSFEPILIIQRGIDPDLTKPFDQEVGVLVPKGTQPAGEARVRSLAAFPCATTVITGALAEGGKAAFETLFRAAMDQGRVPTGETRELMLFWEGEGSANNMMLAQIGLR